MLEEKNLFISQLEEEIAKEHCLGHIYDTQKNALLYNNLAVKDKVIKQENKSYINRLVANYEKKVGKDNAR